MSGYEDYRPNLRRRRSAPGVVIGSVAAVVLASVLVFAIVQVAAQNPEQANLGPTEFRFRADDLAEEVDDDGPFLLKDPLNRGREVFVQHVGDDEDDGWYVIRAYAGDADLDCLLEWDPEEDVFRDPCTGREFAADGSGLTRYEVAVKDGVVAVDLRSER